MTRLALPHAWHHLFGNRPIGQQSALIDLKATEHHVATANETERHRTVERTGTRQRRNRTARRIRQCRMRHALLWNRSGPDQPVLGLEENLKPGRKVICHERRDSDAQVHQHAR
jgi:hypothetical protein